VEKGLVDGRKLFCDSSLIEADASCNSVVDTQGLKRYLSPAYRELEARLEEREEKENKDDDPQGTSPRRNIVNQRSTSTTDPDASVVSGSGITIDSAEKPLECFDSLSMNGKISNDFDGSSVRPEALEG